jgi:AcrR family transcriptional regulator
MAHCIICQIILFILKINLYVRINIELMTKTLTPEDTRRKILEAAIRLIRKIGVENITLQKVAKEARVSYYAVYYHFKDKGDELTHAAIEYVGKEAQKFISAKLETAAQDPDADLIAAYIRSNIEWSCERPEHASCWLYYYYICSSHPKLRGVNSATMEVARQRIERLINESVGRQHMAKPRDAKRLAFQIHSHVVGAFVTTQIDNDPNVVSRVIELEIDAVRKLIAAEAL